MHEGTEEILTGWENKNSEKEYGTESHGNKIQKSKKIEGKIRC
jgi:hypothetical protein